MKKKVAYPLIPKNRYSVLILVMAMSVVIVEAVEHSLLGESLFETHFLVEVLIFGAGLPLLAFIMLGIMERVQAERDRALQDLDIYQAFNQELSQVQTLADLVQRVVRFPSTILPTVQTFLHLFEPDRSSFHLVADWCSGNGGISSIKPDLGLQECQVCLQSSYAHRTIRKCEALQPGQLPAGYDRYLLPLTYGNAYTGVLHLDLPANSTIRENQTTTLSNLAPEMAIAIESMRLQQANLALSRATENERKRIAQDLHDTLGQSIAYLRFKLDHLNSQDPVVAIGVIRKDLDQMREMAESAYTQVRETLAKLHPSAQVDLLQALRTQLEQFRERVGLEVVMNSRGTPQPLPPHLQRQVLYICREVLNNVEKHARARRLTLEVFFKAQELQIVMTDDGRGFDVKLVPSQGNYGLTIMHERADSINGQILLSSSPGKGTQVTLRVPLAESLLAGEG